MALDHFIMSTHFVVSPVDWRAGGPALPTQRQPHNTEQAEPPRLLSSWRLRTIRLRLRTEVPQSSHRGQLFVRVGGDEAKLQAAGSRGHRLVY